jgi:CPA1 family monovalent cation:H+ antiporter
MDINGILSITIVLAAIFGYINHRWIKWPPTIGIMILALLASIVIAVSGKFIPAFSQKAIQLVAAIDFQKLLMNFMLSFLLFAGAIQINARKLKKERLPIIILSTVGTIISTFLIGVLSWYLFKLFGLHVDFIYCLLFGALISPTDPIAVLAILKTARIPSSLEIKISGESLFNDGVAVVLFISIAEVAKNGAQNFEAIGAIKLFMQQAVGGLLFGAILGYTGFVALRSIDNYAVEILITLAIVMGGYTMARYLGISGPLAMVVAGIITGSKVKDEAMSDITQDYLTKFWEMVDEILNAVLFLLIGVEMLVIKFNPTVFFIGLIIIVVVLLARWISVFVPISFLRFWIPFEKNAIAILTWGGLRGGLSVALALSLSPSMHKDEFVVITYMVAVFSILVQGLTIGRLVKRLSA